MPALALLLFLSFAQPSVHHLIAEGQRLFQVRSYPESERAFRAAVDAARAAADTQAEAVALRGLAQLDNARGNLPAARRLIDQALALQPAPLELARLRNALAYNEWARGNRPAALALYRQALPAFEASGEPNEKALALYNIAFLTAPAERAPHAQAALAEALRINDTRLAGKCHHMIGDALFSLGDARAALESLERALPLLDGPANRADRARVFNSLARLYLTHRRPLDTIRFTQQALDIQRQLNDRQGMVYSLMGLASAHRILGQPAAALPLATEALSLATQTTSPSLISNAESTLAHIHLASARPAEALALLQSSLQRFADISGTRLVLLARLHLELANPDQALAAADNALALARKAASPDTEADALYWRARALSLLGRNDDAAQALHQALDLREALRARTAPTDYLKRGYGESAQSLYAFAVDHFFTHGRTAESLAAAEHARGRAFLDLLATRALQDQLLPDTHNRDIPSTASAPPPTPAALRALAARLQTLLVLYWTGPQHSFVWLVPPQGDIASARIPASAESLASLVQQASQLSAPAAPWRELHRLLLDPLRPALAAHPTLALTIIPHGPLHRLSFAALQDPSGRYLVESRALHYAPTPATFQYLDPPPSTPPAWLLVANPAPLPPAPSGRPLPALPGAQDEALSVARAAAPSPVTRLTGPDASEARVRAALPARSVLHFATHGVLADDQPFDSFLALGRGSSNPNDDGRLTVREIYDLDIPADLIVLSACYTAAGPVTGDGIVGMTRAFFAAGARSLLATQWAVADEPTRRLISRFYHHLPRLRSKAVALRAAQLDLLSALRRGQLSVSTPLGPTTLSEHPVFWAAFTLQGQP